MNEYEDHKRVVVTVLILLCFNSFVLGINFLIINNSVDSMILTIFRVDVTLIFVLSVSYQDYIQPANDFLLFDAPRLKKNCERPWKGIPINRGL